MLKELVKERLMAAADEIFELFERAIASYEEELCRTREGEKRHRRHPETVCQTRSELRIEDVQKPFDHQEERPPQLQTVRSTLKQEAPQPPHIKEEEEERWTTQKGLQYPEETNPDPDLTKLPQTVVSVKTDDHEEKPPSLLHLGPNENNNSSSLTQHMTTEADWDHYGASQADNDHTMSQCSAEEPLSSDADCEGAMRTRTDNKHPECSTKKTGKKSFSHKNTRPHAEEKPFSCSICGKTFLEASTMLTHLTTHTGEKPFSCSFCVKTFSRRNILAAHMRTHTGEKPFSCSVCAQTFAQKVNMTTHMRRHTGEKPFTCSVCDKRFTHKVTMVKHMRTHTGEKPYVCSVCDKGFTTKTNMLTHLRNHAGENH
uniref:zinc finger protein 135-like n=1 Tax=Doryrhamphus excisus TaxID=161450 RepID=UPI0025AE62AC|nr:zinc finger protein 135-like [Doryrhamphus excisus]